MQFFRKALLLIVFLLLGGSPSQALDAQCSYRDDIQPMLGNNYPHEFYWHGEHYSNICDCGGVISGAGDPDDASLGIYCKLGAVCRCGTFNDKPWMGTVISDPKPGDPPMQSYP